jgi:peptide/nickel transport system ATP-binding protein/oligopeptide transport system ATP-binding protein
MGTPVLELDAVRTTFPMRGASVPIVDQVSLSVEPGKVLAVVGESGCGKSMTALSIMRLVPRPGRVDGGRILLDGRNLLELSVPEMRSVRGRQIAMIFQEPMTSLNPVVRVGVQVMEATLLHERVSKQAARARGIELFRRVGIPDPEVRFDAYPHQLSGGLKQRVMIAMALVARPRVLLADEPTTALDVTIQAQILELMRELQRDFETAIVLITHDLGVVNELADHIAVMYAGRVIERGTRAEVLGGARHPYTRGLLAAIPSRNAPGSPLHEIPGVVPAPHAWPRGCRFCTRCERAFEPCEPIVPKELLLPGAHRVWCHAVERDLQVEGKNEGAGA